MFYFHSSSLDKKASARGLGVAGQQPGALEVWRLAGQRVEQLEHPGVGPKRRLVLQSLGVAGQQPGGLEVGGLAKGWLAAER